MQISDSEISLKLESRSITYAYSNTRIKAMRAALIKPGFMDELIQVPSIDAMTELLQRSGYKDDLIAASVHYAGSSLIASACARNFAREVKKVVGFTPKKDRKALKVLLARWDLINLKTLMHARKIGRTYDEVKHLLYDVGGMDEENFKRILRADEDGMMREIRKTEIGKHIDITKSGKGLFSYVEATIDSQVYLYMNEALASVGGREMGYIRDILKREIDAKNIMIVERLKKHDVEPAKIKENLIKGGTITRDLFDRIIEAKDLAQVVSLTKHKFHRLELKPEGNLIDLEIALEKSIAGLKKNTFSREVLSLGVIIDFLLIKEEEINNLRKIAKGKQYRFSEDEVRAMLV